MTPNRDPKNRSSANYVCVFFFIFHFSIIFIFTIEHMRHMITCYLFRLVERILYSRESNHQPLYSILGISPLSSGSLGHPGPHEPTMWRVTLSQRLCLSSKVFDKRFMSSAIKREYTISMHMLKSFGKCVIG